jgi:hypothetical protein
LRKIERMQETTTLSENLKLEKRDKKILIQKSEIEIKKLKIDIKVIKSKLLTHYYDILKVGLDTR